MSKPMPYINEVVSLTIMLLMIIALVASQAGAAEQEEARASAAYEAVQDSHDHDKPFKATIEAHIESLPLMISIDAKASIDLFRLEDE